MGDAVNRLDEILASIDADASALRRRAQELLALAVYDEHAKVMEHGAKAVLAAADSARTSRAEMAKALAHARRPKGLIVQMRHSSNSYSYAVEVIFRDVHTFTVLDNGRMRVLSLRTGRKPGPVETTGGFIHKPSYAYVDEADRARVRAMPKGENEVSRAYAAIEAKV
jgi:hypothetical protein